MAALPPNRDTIHVINALYLKLREISKSAIALKEIYSPKRYPSQPDKDYVTGMEGELARQQQVLRASNYVLSQIHTLVTAILSGKEPTSLKEAYDKIIEGSKAPGGFGGLKDTVLKGLIDIAFFKKGLRLRNLLAIDISNPAHRTRLTKIQTELAPLVREIQNVGGRRARVDGDGKRGGDVPPPRTPSPPTRGPYTTPPPARPPIISPPPYVRPAGPAAPAAPTLEDIRRDTKRIVEEQLRDPRFKGEKGDRGDDGLDGVGLTEEQQRQLARLDRVPAKLTGIDDEIKRLNARNLEIQERHRKLVEEQTKQRTTQDAFSEELARETKRNNEVLEFAKRAIASSEKALADGNKALAGTERLDRDFKVLKEGVTTLGRSHGELSTRVEAAEHRITGLDHAQGDLRDQHNALRERVGTIDTRNTALHRTQQELKIAFEADQANRERHGAVIDRISAEHDKFNDRIGAVEGEHREMRENLTALDGRQTRLEVHHTRYEGRIGAVERTHAELNELHRKLKESHDAAREKYETDMKHIRDAHEPLVRRLDTVERGHTKLSEQHTALDARNRALSDRHTALDERQNALSGEVNRLTEGHAALTGRVNTLGTDHGRLIGELRADHTALAGAHGVLRTDHDNLSARHTGLHHAHDDLRDLHQGLREKVDTLGADHGRHISALRTDVDALAREHRALVAEHGGLADHHRTLDAKVTRETAALQQALAEQKAAHDADMQRMQREIDQLKTELAPICHGGKLTAEMQALRDRHADIIGAANLHRDHGAALKTLLDLERAGTIARLAGLEPNLTRDQAELVALAAVERANPGALGRLAPHQVELIALRDALLPRQAHILEAANLMRDHGPAIAELIADEAVIHRDLVPLVPAWRAVAAAGGPVSAAAAKAIAKDMVDTGVTARGRGAKPGQWS